MGHVSLRLLFLFFLYCSSHIHAQVQSARLHFSAELAAGSEALSAEPAPSVDAMAAQDLAVSRLPVFALPNLPPPESSVNSGAATASATAMDPAVMQAVSRRGFQWGPAMMQSFTFLAIQHGGLLASDQWTRRFATTGKFLPDWGAAVRGWARSGWSDGDPWLDNYIGHPLQGAVTGYIQVQNDPAGAPLEIGWNRQYWSSRLKATAWAAAYSVQFEIGPISEASISNLGSYEYMGDHGRMTTGMGMVDFVMTPAGGLGWMLMEDALDRWVVKRFENGHGRGRWANFLRCALNPGRTAANMLRLKAPWYRDGRDAARLR